MTKKTFFLFLGPLLSLVTWLSLSPFLEPKAIWTAAITALCAVWWLTEPIPIPATSLLPFVLFPLTGVMSEKSVASAYGHYIIILFMAGFILSRAMEKSGAHRRIALWIIRGIGSSSGRKLVFGFMAASAFLSMWISNTATTLMLLPVVLAVTDEIEDKRLATALLLGVAYAASIGGIATPIGTPPNGVFMGVYHDELGREMAFAEWMKIGLPVVLVLFPIAWLVLTWKLRGKEAPLSLPKPGPWKPSEIAVLTVFALTALAWITRKVPFGGWSSLLGIKKAGDSTVALLAVVALFIIPGDEEGESVLDWRTAVQIPWGLLLLFGGGIAIARAFKASGLSAVVGKLIAQNASLHPFVLILAISLAVTFLTEITSNTATATVLMPILAAAGKSSGIDPALLMIPAAISASCAFMLPVATPPNAIVFGTEQLSIRQMARAGFWINILGALAISTLCYLML